MKIGLRKKNAEVKAQTTELKDDLKHACEELNRPDLYEPLRWTLNIEPRGRDLNQLLSAGTANDYCIAGNAMLYESKLDQAKKYFDKALELPWTNPTRRAQLTVVVANLDVASRIARRYWELTGKGTVGEQKPDPAKLAYQ